MADATAGAILLATEESIDLDLVEGSGSSGRVTKDDVTKYMAAQSESVSTTETTTEQDSSDDSSPVEETNETAVASAVSAEETSSGVSQEQVEQAVASQMGQEAADRAAQIIKDAETQATALLENAQSNATGELTSVNQYFVRYLGPADEVNDRRQVFPIGDKVQVEYSDYVYFQTKNADQWELTVIEKQAQLVD